MKRLLLALFVLMAPMVPAHAALATDASLVAKAQDYLKQLGRIRYEITIEREGVTAGGRAFIDRPGRKARIEVDQPYRDLLLVDGPVIQYEGGDGTVTRQATRASPLRLLFLPDVDLTRDAKLVSVEESGGQVALTLEQPNMPRAGQITLRFVQSPQWSLVGWDFVDPRGVRGRVSIDYARTDVTFPRTLFQMRDDFRRSDNP